MGIGMWGIFSYFRSGTATPLIQDGRQSIERARLFLDENDDSQSVLVGTGRDFFRTDVDVVIANGYDMILVREAELETVFDEVCNIIDRYQAWEDALRNAVHQENGLQVMIDSSYPLIRHAMFVYGRDGKAIAISSHFPPSTHWLWGEILEAKGLTSQRMLSLKDDIELTTVFQDEKPTVRASSIDNSYEYMHCSLRADGLVCAHLVLFSFSAPFEPGLDQTVMELVKHGDAYANAHSEQFASSSDDERMVAAMLNGDQFAASSLFEFLNLRQWKLDDDYRVHVLTEAVRGEPVLLTRAFNFISQETDNAIVSRSNKNLLILENQSKSVRKGSASWLLDHSGLLRDNFHCGTSAQFRTLAYSKQYYLQAIEESNRAAALGTPRSCAEDHCADYLSQRLESDELAMTYARPELKELRRFDRSHGTSYYETLRAYCICGFQGMRTARFLGIHRNSLLYRLDRIREIIDFSRYDELAAHPDVLGLNEIIASFMLIDHDS